MAAEQAWQPSAAREKSVAMSLPSTRQDAMRRRPHRRAAAAVLCAALMLLSACGGGDEAPPTGGDSLLDRSSALVVPQDRTQAHRFLVQATFGPTAPDIERLTRLGYDDWIDEQLAMQPSSTYYALVKRELARRNTQDPYWLDFQHGWWTLAVRDGAQLRHRVAFALSEIFVVSGLSVDARLLATYMDMLTAKGTGSYRELLESVALHPAMGTYLSHLYNRKEDPTNGRVPDENFAREVMQLFSIGLHLINDSGQAIDLDILDEDRGIAHMVRQVEPQPHQRHHL